jgi:hypothetical protein
MTAGEMQTAIAANRNETKFSKGILNGVSNESVLAA